MDILQNLFVRQFDKFYLNPTNLHVLHCVKSVRSRSYSGPHLLAFGPE